MNGWFVARTSQSSLPSVSFAMAATATGRRGAVDAGTSSASSIVDVKRAEARANARSEALRDGQIAERVRAMMVFDRNLVKAHRDRAAFLQERALKTRPEQPPDALLDELARRLLDRLRDIKRDFKRIVVLGGACEAITRRLLAERKDVETIVVVDLSKDMLDFVQRSVKDTPQRSDGTRVEVIYVQGDEENLPIKEQSVDAIVSCLGMHWVNDLPGAMSSARNALVPDGLFLSCIFGGNTLQELRVACALAETEQEGGVSARVSPLAHVRDCGSLLGQAELSLPAVDVDIVTMGYSSPTELVDHLRTMAETNAGINRRPFLPRGTAIAATTMYEKSFPLSDSDNQGIEATYEVLYMTGWRAHASQQAAMARGSATVSLSDLQKHLDGKDSQAKS